MTSVIKVRHCVLEVEHYDRLRLLAYRLGISKNDLIRYLLRTGQMQSVEALTTSLATVEAQDALREVRESVLMRVSIHLDDELDEQLCDLAQRLHPQNGQLYKLAERLHAGQIIDLAERYRIGLIWYLVRTGLEAPMETLEVLKTAEEGSEDFKRATRKLQKIREDAEDHVSELVKRGLAKDLEALRRHIY